VALLMISLLFTAAGAAMIAAGAPFGWLALGFGVVGLAVLGFTLVRPNRLELSADGFTTVTLGRRWSVAWSDCGEFRTWKDTFYFGSPTMVVFECRAPLSGGRALKVAAEALTGENASLPETYGMAASDLAALLNEYRLAAIARDRTAP
jgi:hypothetical protein